MKHEIFNKKAEEVRWSFDGMYSSANDADYKQDLAYATKMAENFARKHKGNLATTLGQALEDMAAIDKVLSKLYVPFFLKVSTNQKDEASAKARQKTQQVFAQVSQKLVFFTLEIGKLEENAYQNLLKTDKVVAKHKPYLDQIRAQAQYNLSEEQEVVAAAMAPYTSRPWDDYLDYLEGVAKFSFEGQEHSLKGMLDIISESTESKRRFAAQQTINRAFKERGMTEARARALNVMVNSKKAMDDLRGYTNPMQSRNIGNMVDDATVQALHDAVLAQSTTVKRFYKLKARLLGQKTLAWSDRNAPLPITPNKTYSWGEGLEMTLQAMQKFSPTLAGHFETMIARGWLDVGKTENRQGGAYLMPFFLPGEDKARSYLFMTYSGTARDVSTLAHEAGHGVHYQVSSPVQGPLMFDAPMVYAETASIFAEMLLFTDMLNQISDDKERLALLVDNINDMMNSVVRQISFSLFEQEIHKRVPEEGGLSAEDYSAIWLEVTRKLYGENGDVFTYDDMDALWCYVGHFMSPFYVYAYAFGELFTRRLFMAKDELGDSFEPKYLELLRAGGTKNAVELMAPFSLNPNTPTFWQEAIEGSMGTMLAEAEQLADKLGL